MSMHAIINEFFELEIQPEQILHLGTMCYDSERWPDQAKEAFEQDFDEVFDALGIDNPDDDEDMEEVYVLRYHLRYHNKHGWLIQFATPVVKFVGENSIISGWGYYSTCWVYSDTYEDACTKAIEWARKRYEKAKAEHTSDKQEQTA